MPEFQSFLRVLERLQSLSANTHCYVVLDLTAAKPDAQKRQQLVTWVREHGSVIQSQIKAIAFVAPSAFLRGALTAVRWFTSDRVLVNEVFETRAEALRWIELRQRQDAR